MQTDIYMYIYGDKDDSDVRDGPALKLVTVSVYLSFHRGLPYCQETYGCNPV